MSHFPSPTRACVFFLYDICIRIDRQLPPGIRCTVQIDPKDYGRPGKRLHGTVVSPSTPREDNGTYWGYTTRIANSIRAIFDECPFKDDEDNDHNGYDLKIGTSERGDVSVEDKTFQLPPQYKHALIVFGGVDGIEECVDADETMKLPGSRSKELFDLWVNVCPFQGSRTIRTEEAVLLSLAKFSPLLAANIEVPPAVRSGPASDGTIIKGDTNEDAGMTNAELVNFSDDGVSDESSESEESD